MTAKTISPELIWALSDALKAASKLLDSLPTGGPDGIDALLDEKIYPGDMGALAARLHKIADDWDTDRCCKVAKIGDLDLHSSDDRTVYRFRVIEEFQGVADADVITAAIAAQDSEMGITSETSRLEAIKIIGNARMQAITGVWFA